MRIIWNGKTDITKTVTKIEWSGADTQASRSLNISVAHDRFDKSLKTPDIKTGDKIALYKGKEKNPRYIGRVMNRQKNSDIGTYEIETKDYMHYLLQSSGTYKFKNKTPEYITSAVLKDVKISAGNIMATKTAIPFFFPAQKTIYEIIVSAYRKARQVTGKEYFFRMNGTKFEVIEKGEIIKGLVIADDASIYQSAYEENADDIVNKVVAYKKNGKQVGVYTDNDSIKKYGIYQEAIEVEKGNGLKEAKNCFRGMKKQASISAIGNWDCIAGRGVYIKDKASGLTGYYWITNDTHTFENGIHTMDLDLAFRNVMENTNSDIQTKKETKKVIYYKAYTGNKKTFIEALDQRKIESTMAHRKKIAKASGMKGYIGTEDQDGQLLEKFKEGTLARA